MHVGQRIKCTRTSKKLSQATVSNGILSTSHYSNIESGRYDASPAILSAIAERLSVPDSYLNKINTPSQKIEQLLSDYDHALETGVHEADTFLQNNQKNFIYILSMTHEIRYLLLYCSHFLRKGDTKLVYEPYKKIHSYVNDDDIKSFPKPLRFKYYYVSGLYHFVERNYTTSYEYYTLASENTYKEHDQANIKYNLSLVFLRINDVYRAQFYLQESRKIYLDLQKWNETVKTYNLMGILQIENGHMDNAENVFTEGIKIAKERNFVEEEMKILHNLGLVEFNKKNYDKSIDYFQKSIKLKKKDGNKNEPFLLHGLFISYLAILNSLMHARNFDGVKEKLTEKNQYCHEKIHFVQVQVIEAKLAYELTNFPAYEKEMENAIDYLYKHSFWNLLEDIAAEFSNHFADKHHYKKANDYLTLELEVLKKLYKERFS